MGTGKINKIAIAIAAHPDDIEFVMAGTLLLLKQKGWEIHYINLSSGNCGSMKTNATKTRAIRRRESTAAAKILGAEYHPSICDDLEIIYDVKTLRRLSAVLREVAPGIVLTHSPQDYMEDHVNTSRLAVSATFTRGMPNFKTTPSRRPVSSEAVVYHAMPHGLRDPLRRRIIPEIVVNTETVQNKKREALGAHRSQKEWLDASQGMDSYLKVMEQMAAEVAGICGPFKVAEGWRRHLHLGFSSEENALLEETLKEYVEVNANYRKALETGE